MTVRIANNENIRRQRQQIINKTKHNKPTNRKTKPSKTIDDEQKHSSNIPIAPMSPQLSNVRKSLPLYQESIHDPTHSSQIKAKLRSSRYMQRTSIATTLGHQRTTHVDSSAANSSSTSPINLSRSTSPAASIANFIRPISPPCIQVKQPISPKFSRTSSITHYRHRSPPLTVPSMTNNIDTSTASATRTLDYSSGFDGNNNSNDQTTIDNVPENCFEPETYRNLYPFNSNQQKKISLSDPTLNQTRKLSNQCQSSQQQVIINSSTTDQYFSVSSFQKQSSKEDEQINTEHEDDEEEEDSDNDEINNLSKHEETSSKEKTIISHSEPRKVSYINNNTTNDRNLLNKITMEYANSINQK